MSLSSQSIAMPALSSAPSSCGLPSSSMALKCRPLPIPYLTWEEYHKMRQKPCRRGLSKVPCFIHFIEFFLQKLKNRVMPFLLRKNIPNYKIQNLDDLLYTILRYVKNIIAIFFFCNRICKFKQSSLFSIVRIFGFKCRKGHLE